MNEHELVSGVENCTLAGSEFHHADHVRLAWVYLRDYPPLEAIARFTTVLRRFAAHHGAAGKYHETITWAYLLLIHDRMRQDGAPCDWEGFRSANADLLTRKPSILERYYTVQMLASERARKSFVLPDAGLEEQDLPATRGLQS